LIVKDFGLAVKDCRLLVASCWWLVVGVLDASGDSCVWEAVVCKWFGLCLLRAVESFIFGRKSMMRHVGDLGLGAGDWCGGVGWSAG
jgi:hypothetical protein